MLCFALLTVSLPCLFSQDNNTPPPPTAASSPVAAKKSGNVNADLVTARKATAEKRFADSEALMQQVTQTSPNLILPWVELGLAQLGLKKYPEAENSFKTALGIDPASLKRQHADDFYQSTDSAPGKVAPTAVRASRNTAGETVSSGENRPPGRAGREYGRVWERSTPMRTSTRRPRRRLTPRRRFTRPMPRSIGTMRQSPSSRPATRKANWRGQPGDRARSYPGRKLLLQGAILVSKATLDPQTQKMVLPPGCAEAYQKYLELEPNGPYSARCEGNTGGSGTAAEGGKEVEKESGHRLTVENRCPPVSAPSDYCLNRLQARIEK